MVSMPASRNRPKIAYAWRGGSLLIVDQEGRAGREYLTGYFFRETRYLCEVAFEIDGDAPWLCSVTQTDSNELEFAYIYPPVPGGASGGQEKTHGIWQRGMDLTVRYRLRAASVEATLRLTNRWNDDPVEVSLAWRLAADYMGWSEVAGGERKQDAPVEADAVENGVRFRYTHEKLPLETHIGVDGPGEWRWQDGRLAATLRLERQNEVEITLRVRAVDSEDAIGAEEEERREERLAHWLGTLPRIHAPGEPPLVAITERGLRDLGGLSLLEGPEDEWLAPAAGVPRFHSLWGRDGLTASWQAAVFDRGELVSHMLNVLGRTQGTKVDDWRDEQPGRIARQLSREPTARLGLSPSGRYYGDVAAPFMFIIALGNAYAWSGEKRLIERHWDACRRILDWAREYGDRDGDGYIEYLNRSPSGPAHQGWKDSENAVVSEDGRQVSAPIAAAEIQGYWHASLRFMAVLSAVMGSPGDALDLWKQAAELRERFNRDFWLEEEGTVAFGLDPDKRQIRSIVSNAGHCVTAGIVSDEHVPRVVRRLFEPDMFSGWGIRTLSTKNPAYNPMSYHLGTVWPVENGTILFGLRRYGFDEQAERLARGLHDLARLWPEGRIPECVGGYSRDERPSPGAYPRANAPQLWNQSIWAILVQTLLGMRPVAALDLLAIYPKLPPWLPELTLKRLRVGGASVSLRFRLKDDGETEVEEIEKEGTLHLVEQPPIDSLHAGFWDRLGALLDGVL